MLFAASYFWDRFNSFDFADEINCVNFPYFQDAPENKDIWFATTSEGFCVSAKPGTPEYDAAGRLLNFMLGAETLSGYANEIAKGGIYPLEVDFDMSLASTPMRTFMDGYAGRKRHNRQYHRLYEQFQRDGRDEHGTAGSFCGTEL